MSKSIIVSPFKAEDLQLLFNAAEAQLQKASVSPKTEEERRTEEFVQAIFQAYREPAQRIAIPKNDYFPVWLKIDDLCTKAHQKLYGEKSEIPLSERVCPLRNYIFTTATTTVS